MIFFWLALVALSFGLTGFFLHAFYFSKQELVQSLKDEMQGLEFRLAMRERANSTAQEEIAKARTLVRSLERQLEQRDEQLDALKIMAQRQEEEIGQLQKTASEIRPRRGATDPAEAAPLMGGHEVVLMPESGMQKIPLWKDNLNNILSTLDKIEKESNKR